MIYINYKVNFVNSKSQKKNYKNLRLNISYIEFKRGQLKMKTLFNKYNRGLTISSIFSILLLVEFIRLVVSARFYGNIEFAGKKVHDIPFGLCNVSPFVTDSNSYTSITWLFATFVFVLLSISFGVVLKYIDEIAFLKFGHDEEGFNGYLMIKTFTFYFITILGLIITLRSGFYAALELKVIGGSMIYTLMYIPYFIVKHPSLLIIFGMFLLAQLMIPSRPMTEIEKENLKNISRQRQIDKDRFEGKYRSHNWY